VNSGEPKAALKEPAGEAVRLAVIRTEVKRLCKEGVYDTNTAVNAALLEVF